MVHRLKLLAALGALLLAPLAAHAAYTPVPPPCTLVSGNVSGSPGAGVMLACDAATNSLRVSVPAGISISSAALSTFSEIVPANTTSVAVKASAGQVYDMELGSNSNAPLSNPLYIKFYDAAQGSVTCGSGTPKARYSWTGGSNITIPGGEAYSTAITICVTAGIADNDNTNPAATTFLVTIHYK